jgi:hypothetical protein
MAHQWSLGKAALARKLPTCFFDFEWAVESTDSWACLHLCSIHKGQLHTYRIIAGAAALMQESLACC